MLGSGPRRRLSFGPRGSLDGRKTVAAKGVILVINKLIRSLAVTMMLAGLMAGALHQSFEAKAAEEDGISASSAVLIGSTGQNIGAYSLADPPGYPAAECIGHGITVDLYSPGYVFVGPSINIAVQKAEISPVIYQRLANGLYAKVLEGGPTTAALSFNGPVA